MKDHYGVAIVGGGQAGLSMGYCLKEKGIDHVIFEKASIGYEWRERRWDSFCLVTPNWQCQLPGFPYGGADPQGFMTKDEIVQYLEAYAALINPPIYTGVTVLRVRPCGEEGGFAIATTLGDFTADQVVIAVGGYHIPRVPRMAERLPSSILQMHSS
ncbi:MAG: NAD(P)-binding domain-containing protein, partial [Nodosilinea sp.]